MYPPPSDGAYGYFESSAGIPGQNVETPVEKAFDKHFIVKTSETPDYYDPSYGLTYQNEEDFDEIVFGYFRDLAKDDEPADWWVRRPEDQIDEKNIRFKPNRERYPLCGSGPQL